MSPHAPTHSITADFLTGGPSGERVRRTLTVHDLTEAAGHDTDTQLYHITFGDEDHDNALAVLRGMSVDFLDFYARLQEARDAEGKPLLPLPPLPSPDKTGADLKWIDNLHASLKGALDFHMEVEANSATTGTGGDCSVCTSMLLALYEDTPPYAGSLRSASVAAVPHCGHTPRQ